MSGETVGHDQEISSKEARQESTKEKSRSGKEAASFGLCAECFARGQTDYGRGIQALIGKQFVT